MDDFERHLSQLVHDTVPAPRRDLDPEDVFRAVRPGRGRRAAAVGISVLCVLIVAVAIAVTTQLRTTHSQGAAGPTSSTATRPVSTPTADTNPADLVGQTWVWTAVTKESEELMGGIQQQQPGPAFTEVQFHFQYESIAPGPVAIIAGRCSAAAGVLSAGRLVFGRGFVTTTPTNCSTGVAASQSQVVSSILSGSVSWSITGGKLVISHTGIGSLTFENGSRNDLVGSMDAVGGPAIVPARTMAGVVTAINTQTQDSVRLNVGADGSFAADLPDGSYTVTGQGLGYGGLCKDYSGPAVVTSGDPTFVFVTCQES